MVYTQPVMKVLGFKIFKSLVAQIIKAKQFESTNMMSTILKLV